MVKRLTIILLLGMAVVALTLGTVDGLRSYRHIHQQFSNLGSQNAILGAKIAQHVIEKSIDNGLFDTAAIFESQYQPIPGSEPPRYHTEYDYYFDHNVKTILEAFLLEENIYYAYVVNNGGYIPSHTDQTASKTRIEPPAATDRLREEGAVAGSVVWTDPTGHRFYEFHAPITVYERPWGEFRVGIPAAMVNNTVYNTVRSTLQITVSLAVLIVGLIFYLLRRYLRPLKELTAATAQMAAGNLAVRCRARGHDELGVLASSFNAMATGIETIHDGLEELVQQRTSELQTANEQLQTEIAERRRAEDSIRENELKFRTLFDSANDSIFIMDGQFFVDCNQRTLEMFGCTREQIINHPPADFSPLRQLDGRSSEEASILRIQAALAGIPQFFEWTHRRFDGELFDVEISLNRIEIAGRQYIQAIVRDITDRKRNEQALRHSERKIRRILETCTEGFWLIDNKTNTLDLNDTMCQILGRTRDQILGHPIFDFTDEENTRLFKENVAKRARGESGSYEVSLLRPDGSLVPCQVNATPLHDEQGVKIGSFAMFTDITERKRSEQALRDSERRLRAQNDVLVSLATNNVMITGDLEAAIREITESAARTLNVERAGVWLLDGQETKLTCVDAYEQASNRHSEGGELLVADHPAYFEALRSSRVIVAQDARTDARTKDFADGYLVPHQIASRLDGAIRRDGKLIGVLCHEHVGRPRAWAPDEEQFVGSLADLVSLAIQARDRHRYEADLHAAKEAAEAASRAKSEFLANMSHEIRTPMTAILGFTESLLDPTLSDQERLGAIQTVHRNGEHLLSVINNILDLSKIEAGRMTVESIRCSPCQILAEVASMIKVRADGKNLSFEIECPLPIPDTIRTDPTRLRQILINLIGNSIKFTEVGGVRLVATFLPGDSPLMQFDVIDRGIGMSSDQAARLFEPFSQGDTSTARQFGGTGLGLVISKRFAQMLGGDIVLISTRLNAGSQFRVTIATGPLDGVSMVEDPSSATAVAPAKSHGKPLPSLTCRILLAEDGPDNQRLISFVLRKAGAEVVVASNGRSAVDLALASLQEDRPFDIVLMDMQMPVMDGYEATAWLRQKGYDGPIIALTAHAMASDRERCIKVGCTDYTTKPIDRPKLIAMINSHLSTTDSTDTDGQFSTELALVTPDCPQGEA